MTWANAALCGPGLEATKRGDQYFEIGEYRVELLKQFGIHKVREHPASCIELDLPITDRVMALVHTMPNPPATQKHF